MESEDQSAYWFLKGEMQSRAPLNQMDLEQILEMLQNVPAKEMNEAIEQAEMFGDEAAMIVLVMADNKRKFREKYASEDYDPDYETSEETIARTTAYFAALKDKNPDLARKIEFSVKDLVELPRKEIEDAGFDYDVIDEWVEYVGFEDENLVEFDQCSDCEGEGIIITKYYPATRYDPPDADFKTCDMCFGSGRIDPADYMDYDGNYMAESFNAESTEGQEELLKSIMVDFANEIVYEPHFGFTNKDWLKGWTYSYEDGPRLNYKTMRITDVVFDSTFYWDTLYFDISNMEVASDISYNWSKRKEIGDEYLDQDSFLKIQKIASMLRKKYKRPDLEIREVGHGKKGVYGNGREYVEDIRFEISLRSKTYYAESWLTEGKCAICNSPSKFTVMTAIGERSFCCEACYADYVGLPVEEEGYYGLASEDEDLFDCAVCDKTIYENDDPQDDEICNDCLKTHKQCAVCQDYEPYNEMTSCFVCGQNYCAGCDKYDSCEEMNAESWQGKSLAGSLDEMDEMLDRKKAESINPYLLGAGIFALTLGLLSRKR